MDDVETVSGVQNLTDIFTSNAHQIDQKGAGYAFVYNFAALTDVDSGHVHILPYEVKMATWS